MCQTKHLYVHKPTYFLENVVIMVRCERWRYSHPNQNSFGSCPHLKVQLCASSSRRQIYRVFVYVCHFLTSEHFSLSAANLTRLEQWFLNQGLCNHWQLWWWGRCQFGNLDVCQLHRPRSALDPSAFPNILCWPFFFPLCCPFAHSTFLDSFCRTSSSTAAHHAMARQL